MKKYIIVLSAAALLTACSDTNTPEASSTPPVAGETVAVANAVNIKLSADILDDIDNNENKLTMPTGNSRLDDYLRGLGAKEIYRTFPNSGKYEARHRQNGLNAWYTVTIDTNAGTGTRSAMKPVSGVVDYIEEVRKGSIGTYKVTEYTGDGTRAASDAMMNDPYFNRQWDLKNDGTVGNTATVTSSVAGADINIETAWKQSTGNNKVIVAVVDGGIDITHPDLKDNIWMNEGEIPGNGIDDDNNGYIDDVNGFNFVDGNGIIVAQDHGTHVAGTIAAVTNNGIGISGIAGGNGTPGSGAKVMSCQIFKPNPDYDPNDPDSKQNLSTDDNSIAAAIVYGADNGAVISQNSWGYTTPELESKVVKEAIEYFNANAGQYQGSPMKGGVTIFAAGNDNSNKIYYPACYDNVISVSAYAPDFTATWYTNYGYKTDICAPGGSSPSGGKYPYDENKKAVCEILSLLPAKDGKGRYGFMQGTSMACPHVSGIAALVVSKFASESFTADQLRRQILTGINAEDINSRNAEKYQDRLGIGYIDAAMALETISADAAPAEPEWDESAAKADFTSLTVGWKAAGLASNPVLKYTLFFSEKPITEANKTTSEVTRINVPAANATEGQAFTRTLNGLKTGTRYYFALQSSSRGGKVSSLKAYPAETSTTVNLPPVITPSIDVSKTFTMAGNDRMDISFKLSDSEGQSLTYTMSNKSGLYITTTNDAVNVRFFAANMVKGTNRYELTATDSYGASSSVTVTIEKTDDKAPAPMKGLSVDLEKGAKQVIDLKKVVDDEDPQTLAFTLDEVSPNNITAALNGAELTVTGHKYGSADIKITATDKHAQSTQFTISVLVYMDKGIASLFPTLAEEALYVKLGSDVQGDFTLTMRNAAGKEVMRRKHNTSELDAEKRTLLLTVKSLYPGKYTLSIINNGNTYQQSFIKK